jgi:hypothetical protein
VGRYTFKQHTQTTFRKIKKSIIMKIKSIILGSSIATTLLIAAYTSFDQTPLYETDNYGDYSEYIDQHDFDDPREGSDNEYSNSQEATYNPQNRYNHMTTAEEQNQAHNYDNDKLVMKPLIDPQSGMPFGFYPLPESWSIKKDGWYGPNGTKVVIYTQPAQNAMQAPYQNPQHLLNGRIGQEIQKAGGSVLGTENLPAIAACDKAHRDLHWTPNVRKTMEAMGLEVVKDGKKGFGIIKTEYHQSQYSSMWMYSVISMDANPGYYEQAKKILIYALSNFKPNMQQIANWNRIEQQRSNASWASHNARMRSNQQNFESRNQALQNTYNDINDITMQTYRNQSASFDRSNQSITNGIYNENTVTNPYDGNSYQTDANYDRTFMNAFGEQIQTNDQFYSPDRDPNAVGYQEVYPNGGGY